MRGTIGTTQKCPCGRKFTVFDNYGLKCPECVNSRPTRYYVQAKYFGLGRLYSTPNGKPLDSYERAKRLLSSIQTSWDDAKEKKDTRFNPRDWLPQKVKARRFNYVGLEWLKIYDQKVTHKQISKGRCQTVTNILKTFIMPYFGEKDINKIEKSDIREFWVYLLQQRQPKTNKPYSTRYIKDILNELKALFIEYREDMPAFPDHRVIPTVERQWLQYDRQVAVDFHIPDKYRLPIKILQLGMRPGELRALQVNDMVDGCLKVWKAISGNELRLTRKNGGDVTYPVPYNLWQELIEHTRDKRPDDFIFAINGRPLGSGRLYKVWRKSIEGAGVKYISLYMASRHSYASREMDKAKKEALERIQERLGHHNKQTAKKHYIMD